MNCLLKVILPTQSKKRLMAFVLLAVLALSSSLSRGWAAPERKQHSCPTAAVKRKVSLKNKSGVHPLPGVYRTTRQRRFVVERLVSQPITVPATETEKLNAIVFSDTH
jgi:hypothetical protein